MTPHAPPHQGQERRAGASRAALYATIIEESFSEIYVLDAETLGFVVANKTARQNLGYTIEELQAMSAHDIKPDLNETRIQDLFRPLIEHQTGESIFHTTHRRKNGTSYPVEVHSRISMLDGRQVIFQIVIDQTELKHVDARAQFLSDIELEASKSKSSGAFLEAVLKQLCRWLNWTIGHAYLWNGEQGILTSAPLWCFTGAAPWHDQFRLTSEALRFASGDGLPGKVHAHKSPFYIADTSAAAHLMQVAGTPIREAFAIPIYVKNEIAAVLEFFSDAAERPDRVLGDLDEVISVHISRLYERKRWEEDLAEIHERFDTAIRGANVGIWDYNFRTGKFGFSPLCRQMLGVAATPETWNAYFELIIAEDVQHVRDALAAHAALRGPLDVEYRLRRGDGETIWLRMRGQGIWEANGHIARTAGAINDITADKEAEFLRREIMALIAANGDAGEKIQSTLERACHYLRLPMGMVSHIADGEYHVLYATPSAALKPGACVPLAQTLCGDVFSSDGVQAFASLESSSLTDHPGRAALGAEAYLGAPIFVQGVRFGTLCFFSHAALPTPFAEANIAIMRLLALWIGDEIARASHIATLLENDLRKSANLASVGDAVLTVNESGGVEDANPAAAALFGIDGDSVRGLRIEHLLPTVHAFSHPDGRLMSVKAREDIALRMDGERVMVSLHIFEVRLNDRVVYTVTLSDLTAVKQAETAKREFVSVVSHELRTPLTSICGALELLGAQTTGELPAGTSTLIDIAQRNCGRLLRLVNDILDIEKLETGHFDLTLGDVDLAAALGDAVSANTAYAARFGVAFDLTIEPSLPCVIADPDRLLQVMANLLSNAAKFTRPNTTVEIEATSHGTFARVEVRDHGLGIPEAFSAQLFEKFTQGAQPNTREREGSGLGLSITRELVRLMNGEIGFHSEAGLGTTFYFDLPLATRVTSDIPQDHDNITFLRRTRTGA